MLKAQLTIFLKCARDDVLKLSGYSRVDLGRWLRSGSQYLGTDYAGALALKRQTTCGHLVQHDAERKQISSLVQFLGSYLLRRHISHCPNHSTLDGQVFVFFRG